MVRNLFQWIMGQPDDADRDDVRQDNETSYEYAARIEAERLAAKREAERINKQLETPEGLDKANIEAAIRLGLVSRADVIEHRREQSRNKHMEENNDVLDNQPNTMKGTGEWSCMADGRMAQQFVDEETGTFMYIRDGITYDADGNAV